MVPIEQKDGTRAGIDWWVSVKSLTPTLPSEPLKPSTGAAVRDHRNAVRDRSESLSAIDRNHCPHSPESALQYDLLNDFEPVALLSTGPYALTAKKTMPANDLKGLIAWLKANPDKATQGHGGTGGPAHIAGVFFQRETGTRFQFVPYRGGAAPAIQDLVAGHIDMLISDPVAALPQVRAGTIKAYGVTTKTRLLSAPDIPTLDEAGLPGFDISAWYGLWLPKGTPKNITAKLNAAVMDALADPMMRARLADLAQETFPRAQQTPEALGAFQKAEIEKWWPIIKAAGIKAD
jgi:tripartite-type tricarboxylate transporter receptor subunit TctC